MSEQIRLLLVDDQVLLREGMRVILDLEEDMTVVGEAGNGQEAIDQYIGLRPDVVLMDVQMPIMNGIDAIRRICQQDPRAKIIILTTFDNDEYIFEGIRAGALGYLLKAISSDKLTDAVRGVYRDEALIEATAARKIIDAFSRYAPFHNVSELDEPLSEREFEILRLMADGQNNHQIAIQLYLAEGTVKNYVSSLMGKLNSPNRTQAVLRAKELGLV